MYAKVKYELQELESLLSFEQPTLENDSILKQSVRFEADRIMQTLALEAFTFHNEDHLQRYVRFHQHGIVRLMDKMGNVSSPDTLFSYSCLDEILVFIERYFPTHFDQDGKPPEESIAALRKEVRINCKKFKYELAEKKADPRLIELLLRLMREIGDKRTDRKITFRKISYVREVQKQLFRLLENPSDTDFNEELRRILYYLNYNSIKVLTYHAHYISELLDISETRSEKIEHLSLVLKKVNQSQVKPGLFYHQRSPSLKDQLSNYIAEELDYQSRSLHTSRSFSENSTDSSLDGFKLNFSASVAQMAYLLRILIDSKVLLNSNLSQTLSFLVKYVGTKKSESISFGSFRSKYYAVESGTKESVRNALVSLLKHIDRN